MTSVPSSVFNWIRLLGLAGGVDFGPFGKDLEGPGLVPGVGVGPSWVLPPETLAEGTSCFQLFED